MKSRANEIEYELLALQGQLKVAAALIPPLVERARAGEELGLDFGELKLLAGRVLDALLGAHAKRPMSEAEIREEYL